MITSLRDVFRSWHDAVGSTPHTTGKINTAAERTGLGGNRLHPELHQALCSVADDRRGGIDTKALGNWLGRHKGRIVDA